MSILWLPIYIALLILNIYEVAFGVFPLKLLNVGAAFMMMWCIWLWNRRRNNV